MTISRSLLVGTVVGVFLLFSITFFVSAFVGPPGNPPSGVGAIAIDGGNRIALGTSTASSSTRLLIVGSSTPGAFVFRTLQSSGTAIFDVRNDGNVCIAGSCLTAWPTSVAQWTTGASIIYPTSTNTNVAVGANSIVSGYKFSVTGRSLFDTCGFGWGGVVSIGCNGTDYPANANWPGASFASNLVLNGLNSTAITFHDANQSISNIRYTNNNFYIGEGQNGFASSTVNFGGAIVLGKYTTDPTGVAGMMYFNTASGTFRCYATSTWSNCGSAGGAVYQ